MTYIGAHTVVAHLSIAHVIHTDAAHATHRPFVERNARPGVIVFVYTHAYI